MVLFPCISFSIKIKIWLQKCFTAVCETQILSVVNVVNSSSVKALISSPGVNSTEHCPFLFGTGHHEPNGASVFLKFICSAEY